MGFIEAVRSAFANYFNFKDRTSRAGYWWFVLFQLILGALATVIDVALFGARVEDIGPASGLVTLAILIPAITAGTRRLHDTGRTGWWQLIAFTVIGIVPLIYWACQPGDHGTNAYGPPPKWNTAASRLPLPPSERRYRMDFMTAVKTCFSKYSDFSGRARRSEYWWFYLFLFVANIAAGVVDAVLGTQIVSGAFALATVLPVLAAGARRLHDTDRSGWWQLLPLGPLLVTIGASFMMEDSLVTGIAAVASLLGAVLLIVWLASDSQPGPNRFGPSPK